MRSSLCSGLVLVLIFVNVRNGHAQSIGCPFGCSIPDIPNDVLASVTPDDIKREMLTLEKRRLISQMDLLLHRDAPAVIEPPERSTEPEGAEEVTADDDDDEEREQETLYVLGKTAKRGNAPFATNLSSSVSFFISPSFKPMHRQERIDFVNLVLLKNNRSAVAVQQTDTEVTFAVRVLYASMEDGSGLNSSRIWASKTVALHDFNSTHFLSIDVKEQVVPNWPAKSNLISATLVNLIRPFLTLEITCPSCRGPISDWPVMLTDPNTMPFLEVGFRYQLSPRTSTRMKRRTPTCDLPAVIALNRTEWGECCMFGLIVNFVEIGFEAIVHPESYRTNFCGGRCVHTSSRLYTSVLQKVYHDKKARANMTASEQRELTEIVPCCLPQKSWDLDVVYLDEEKRFKPSKMKGVIVTECGC